MDYSEHGGAPLMGISKPVFKAHGSSNANAIFHAIRIMIDYINANVPQKIEESFNKIKEQKNG